MSELVGDAYVRLTVDSTGMRRAVRNAAKDAGNDFGKQFDERVKKHSERTLDDYFERLAKGFATLDFSHFEKQLGGVDNAMNHINGELMRMRANGGLTKRSLDEMTRDLNKWAKARRETISTEEAIAEEKRLQRIREIGNEAQVKYWAQQERAQRASNENLWKIRRASAKAYDAFLSDIDTERARQEDRLARVSMARDEALWKVRRASAKAYEAYLTDIDNERARQEVRLRRVEETSHKARMRQIQQSGDAQLDYYRQLRIAVQNNDRETMRSLGFQQNRILRLGQAFDRGGDRVRDVGFIIGRVFGKGSRNNFLNFFGSAVTSLFIPLRGVVELVGRLGEGVGMLIQNFKLARMAGSGVFTSMLSAARPVMANLVAGLAAVGAAIVGVSFVLPALVSGIFLLAGAITAVVGAISMGLLGGLLAMGPIALALAAGVGAVAIAFKEMSREGSASAASLDRIKKAWSGSMTGLRDDVHGVAHAFEDALIPLMKQFIGPLMSGMLVAVGNITRNFGTMMQSPEIQGFMKLFVRDLPGIFTNFGIGINNLLGGILGMFAAVLPQGQSMAKGFERLTKRFLEFTKSPEGQTQIKDWMDTAWGAANSLWSILGNVLSIIGKIFRSGTEQGGGQSFLSYIDEITTRFDTFLSSAEGQTSIQTFWADVRETMVTVKDIFEKIGVALANIDTEAAREDFNTFLNVVSALATGLESLGTAMGKVRDVAPWLMPGALISKVADFTTGTGQATGKTNAFSDALAQARGENRGLVTPLTTNKNLMDNFKVGASGATGALNLNSGANSKLQGALRASQGALSTTGGSMVATKGKANTLRDAILGIPKTKSVTVKFNTIGEQALRSAGEYLKNLKSRTVTGTIVINGQRINAGQFATGGTVYGPTRALIGEAGPEAVVPLNRPLSQVDPSVRALSAIAQGKAFAGGGVAGGRQVIVEKGAIVVSTVRSDPYLIAGSVVDRLVANVR